MKQFFFISTLTLALSSSVFAGPPVVESGKKGKGEAKLDVNVKINAPSCTFDLNSGQTIDLGLTSPNQLSKDDSKALPAQLASLNVSCGGPILLTMSLKDTHMDTLTSGPYGKLFPRAHGLAQQFALVDKNKQDTLIGSYVLRMKDIRDSSGVHYNMNGVDGTYWNEHLRSSKSDEDRSITSTAFTNKQGTPQYIKDLTLEFFVESQILPTSEFDFNQASPIEFVGETTFKMLYM
ncbi:DUF1120 domain-containing protein [Pseudomonas fluorescens]|uniref:DUF1120 domain-containing protein n=1 Tax=Pseudomonas fluorescens TaxID=294 RepID=UPI002004779E|nr:DUF1120 domain-containing protein [Pseudomonas fluorescens]